MKTKRRTKILLAVIIIFLLAAGGGYIYLFLAPKISNVSDDVAKGNKNTTSLVVYFARSDVIETDGVDAVSSASLNSEGTELVGNTEIPAKMIQKLTGADLYSIQTERYYRSAFMGTAATAWIEETFNMRPGLAAQPADLSKYDVIYVGYPVWWGDMPMAVYSFMDEYDLSGKTVLPFCTHGGSGLSGTDKNIQSEEKDAKVTDGIAISDSSLDDADGDIDEWLKDNGVTK